MDIFPLEKIENIALDCRPQALRTGIEIKVQVGQTVSAHEPLASCEALTVHSPLAGIVSDIEDEIITITPQEADNEFTDSSLFKNKENFIKDIAAIGLAGMGGSVFPSSIKMDAAQKYKVHTLVINGVECEPYTTIDETLLEEESEFIDIGVKTICEALSINDVKIALHKKNAKKNHEFLKKLGYKEFIMPSGYPAGAERLILNKLEKKRYPASIFPFKAGYLIHNTATLWALGKAVKDSKGVTERPLSVIWNNNRNVKNIIVPVGVKVGDVIKEVTGSSLPENMMLVAGGLMMGKEVTENSRVTKGTTSLFVIKDSECLIEKCKMCGRCVDVCPLGLSPAIIANSVDENGKRGITESVKTQIRECFLCGACNAACPSYINLVRYFIEGKNG